MCGIVGYISDLLDKDALTQAVYSLSHRGPDSSGTHIDGPVGMGHSRLSIIDLSRNGHQPKISKDKNSFISYNGEIYNYKQLDQVTSNEGGDTHILLEGLNRKGINFINRLSGMFAFSFFNKSADELYLVRDRLGIKPLFYYQNEENLLYASELKALKALARNHFNLKINQKALEQYLRFGFIPAPETIYEGVKKLEPGCYLKCKNGNVEIERYWSSQTDPIDLSYESAVDHLDALLNNSVKENLISDVPVGSFLSGGIDSGLVTAIAQKHSNNGIKSFTIGFKESKFDESVYARKIAEHLKTDHHEKIIQVDDALDFVQNFTSIYDEPFSDSSALPTLLLTKYASEHVKVMLSGDGGDEVFYGYNRYEWAKRIEMLGKFNLNMPMGIALNFLPSTKFKRASRLLRSSLSTEEIFSQTSLMFTVNEIKSLLLKSDNNLSLTNETVSISNQSKFDLKYYLPDDNLTKVDRASMYNSLEVRVPLLDHKIVEFGNSIPDSYKFSDRITKKILKQVLYRYVPASLYERPKQGFTIPLSNWLRNDLKGWVNQVLDKNTIEEQKILNWETVNQLKIDFFNGKDDIFNKVWLITILQDFLNKELE